MDYWASEIKKGITEIVKIPSGLHLHLSQATLGMNAVIDERVFLEIDLDGNKSILCCLCAGKTDNVTLDHYISPYHRSVTVTTLSSDESSPTSIFLSGYFDTVEEEDDLDESLADEDERQVRFPYPGFEYGYDGDDYDEDDEDDDEEAYYQEDDDDDQAPPLISTRPVIEEIIEGEEKEEEVAQPEKEKEKKKTKVAKEVRPSSQAPTPKEKNITNNNKANKTEATANNKRPATTSPENGNHTKKSKPTLQCQECSKAFVNKNALHAHMTAKHK